ncbi:MAG TPA: CPBP family intramembrane metalloprotease [Fluviicola sp.]|nr:CPBP family intramembrane metalloprotease [Fluviicola sp.]
MQQFFKVKDGNEITGGHYVFLIVVAFTCVLGFSVFLSLVLSLNERIDATKNAVFAFALLPFSLGFLALCFFAPRIIKRKLVSFFSARNQFDWKRFFIALVSWSALMGVAFYFLSEKKHLVWNYDPLNFSVLLALSLLLLPLQTGLEELLFRGVLVQLLGKFINKSIVVVLISSIVFGCLHGLNPEVMEIGKSILIYYILSGIFMGLIVVLDDGLELSWGFHLANNLFSTLIISNNWQVLQTDALFLDLSKPDFSIEIVLTLVLFYPMLLFLFHTVYRWGSWKKKLL